MERRKGVDMPISGDFRSLLQQFEFLKREFSGPNDEASGSSDEGSGFSDETPSIIHFGGELYGLTDLSRGIQDGAIQISKYVYYDAKEIRRI